MVFRCEELGELVRQFMYSPPEKRRTQMDRAEELYWQIEPEESYPLEFVVFRLTGYRPETGQGTTLFGQAVQEDLLTLVDELSLSLEDPVEAYDPPPLDLPAVCAQLNVSEKTVSRYRQRGLFARRMVFPSGKTKLAFLPESVERFKWARGRKKVRQAASFSRIDEPTQHEMILRARRLAGRVDVSPFRVAKHLAGKYGRSVETIRLMLLRHDRKDPRFAIFGHYHEPLTDRRQRVLHRAYFRGVPVAAMAERYGKSRDAIYRAIHRQRAEVLHRLDIGYHASPTFEFPEAEEVILGSRLMLDSPSASRRGRSGEEPSLSAEAEQSLFVRYNYLKFRAAVMRQVLDRRQPGARDLDEIETYLRRAARLQGWISKAYDGVVTSVARKHLERKATPGDEQRLILTGRRMLREAIEQFDPANNRRFAAYLRYALMRRFAQSHVEDNLDTSELARSLTPPLGPSPLVWALTDHLHALDAEERTVLADHLGVGEANPEPMTLEAVGAKLGLSVERVVEIEHRAVRRLREAYRRSLTDR